MPHLRELRHLVAVAEHGHFGRAGQAENISQPALTKSIQKLERELGVILFDRSRRGVTPTTVGQVVIQRAKTVIADVADIRREVDLMVQREMGELSIGVGPAMAETFVADAIAQLAEEYPKTRFAVRVDHWSQLAEWLNEQKLELFVADVTEFQQDEDVCIIPMPPQDFVWFCRKKHPLLRVSRITRKQLLEYPLATPRMPEWARRWIAEVAAPRQKFDPEQRYHSVECENYTMLKRMVLTSKCISVALRSTISFELARGELIELSVKAPKLQTHAGIVHLRHRTLSPLAEAFIAKVQQSAEQISKVK